MWIKNARNKKNLLNRLPRAIQETNTRNTESESIKANETDRNTSNISDASITTEIVKEIFTDMFKEKGQKLLNIVRNGISDTNAHLDWLKQIIKLNELRKETDDLKLNKETSIEINNKNFKERNKKLRNDKQQHGN